MANRYGTQKNKNEQISVGYFCGKYAMMGAKNSETLFHFVFCTFVFFLSFLWEIWPTAMRLKKKK